LAGHLRLTYSSMLSHGCTHDLEGLSEDQFS
jgi:hypothetical protein